ncbi:MAG TPA: hypothetical protein VFS43_32100 [Polyangiaceae bacterium]|nr:hypothetical protein [Polyangiaceae bacterium]
MMTREEVVRDLARWHFTVEPGLQTILWVGASAPETEPLRLLEVTSEQGGVVRGIEVFAFDRTADVPYPTEVAEVTALELSHALAGQLPLPDGWALDDMKAFTRESLGVPDHEHAAQ